MAYTTIDDPSVYFQTALYTGNGGTQSITNDGNSDLQPDWLWIKERSSTSGHNVMDSTRGVGKHLFPSSNGAEESLNIVSSFNSDGWSTGASNAINQSSETYVAWQWKANGGTATATASESGDNPAYSVQANTDAGFSIVTYTGTGADTSTVPHGLGATPKMIIFKRRDGTTNWMVHHANLSSATKRLNLNTTNAEGDASNFLDDTAPTSSVFTLGFSAAVNADGSPFVAYCFAEKQGYSKIGSYTGNGNADGPFVYTGFKPAWTMIKRTTDGTESWIVQDNKRSPTNPSDVFLAPNASNADSTTTNAHIDYLSNGFKLRHSDTRGNTSGKNYIYMAFAESPFVSSEGVPTTAR